ncbi:hypothetical protein ONZ45_g10495 [Pleurotus djamor]|nr:hypothetical protein ONZ45_g17064 [Pleurotus djamor]KAJ8507094.1 hypothetical protein ONZ45_g10495 [Pleurotus djamor]
MGFSNSCCFCLSLRFGALALSVIATLAGFALLIVSIIGVTRLSGDADWYQKFLVWIHVIMYLFLGTFGVVGLIGAIKQRRRYISGFFTVFLTSLTFHISVGIISLRDLFRNGGSIAINRCIKATTDQAVKDKCSETVSKQKKMVVPLMILFWLVHAYGVFVVHQYKKQLKERENKEEGMFLNADA